MSKGIDKAVEQNRLIKQCAGNHDWNPIDPIFPGDRFPLDRECRRCHLISSTTRSKQGDEMSKLSSWETTTIRYCPGCGKEAGTYAAPTAHDCGDPASATIARLRAINADLLAALEGLGSKCRQCREWHRLGCEHILTVKHPDPMPVCDEACESARAAIAQAKGETK